MTKLTQVIGGVFLATVNALIAVTAPAFAADVDAPSSLLSSLPRVVSLDYCADQFVLELADRSQILALSSEAVHVHSFHRDLAQGLPRVKAEAEAVLALAPDVVVRNWGGDARLLVLLQRAGVEVITAAYGHSEDILMANVESFAKAMDRQEEGRVSQREFRQRLKTTKGQKPLELEAIYIAPGGVTAGPGTFVDDIVTEAGFRSGAARMGLSGWQNLPLETLIVSPPDVFIATFFDLEHATASNWSLSRHARVRQLMEQIPVIEVPGRYFSCNGLFHAETVEFLRSAAEELASDREGS